MRAPLSLALVASLTGSGCYTAAVIPTAELQHLDGYDVHNERSVSVVGYRADRAVVVGAPFTDRPYRVLTSEGRPVDFNSEVQLYLHSGDQRAGGCFEHIEVRDGIFSGVTLGERQVIHLPLASIQAAETPVLSRGRTYGLIFGIAGGAFLATAATVIAVFVTLRTSPPAATSP